MTAATLLALFLLFAELSLLAFGGGKRGFDRRNLYVVNFAGEIIELAGVRGPRRKQRG